MGEESKPAGGQKYRSLIAAAQRMARIKVPSLTPATRSRCAEPSKPTSSLVAALGGVDGFVFSAGIAERDALTRAEVVEGSRWTGGILDPARNEHNREGLISADNSSVAVWVIPTDEERLIARRTAAMLQ
jgi:acetate kinase